MPPKLRIAYIAHSLRSDWNNGNAHFLRGLMRSMTNLGHDIDVFEPEVGWSTENLRMEAEGRRSLTSFFSAYPDIRVKTFLTDGDPNSWKEHLVAKDVVILHEWNEPELAQHLLTLRDELGFRLVFHDTHHRASSSPGQIQRFGLSHFDGVLAFGESLRSLYRGSFGISRCWTIHEAADVSIFHPYNNSIETPQRDVVWIGNWGEGERSTEIGEFFLKPAANLGSIADFTIYGVRYPSEALCALNECGVRYGGYLPNLDAPRVYASASLTVHIPRQQYNSAIVGIPTIRVFEALACGIPLISAPWVDSEKLFRPGDLKLVHNSTEATNAMRYLIQNPAAAAEQAQRGLETVLLRHTCDHRAEELTAICEELLS
ncbi:MAG: glycosyltransferase [Acidobacteriota bacterium]|nr:glycosyltransferase [Acidobacteriota bacterium]